MMHKGIKKKALSSMKVFSKSKLKEALSDPRLSIPGVAKITGITRQNLRAYKLGEKEPRSSTLFLIAAALGKPVDYFSENIPDVPLNQKTLPLTFAENRKVGNV